MKKQRRQMRVKDRSLSDYINAEQAGAFLGVSLRTIRSWTKKKMFPSYKIGHFTLLKKTDLIAALEKGRQ